MLNSLIRSLVICYTIGSPLSWHWSQSHCHCLDRLPPSHRYWQKQKYTLCNDSLSFLSIFPSFALLLPLILFSLAKELACLTVHDAGPGSGFLPRVVIFHQVWDQLVWKLRNKNNRWLWLSMYSEKKQDVLYQICDFEHLNFFVQKVRCSALKHFFIISML